jgi:hypothetical protein
MSSLGVSQLYGLPGMSSVPLPSRSAIFDSCSRPEVPFADGKRFLVNTLEEESDSGPFTVLMNWPETIRGR